MQVRKLPLYDESGVSLDFESDSFDVSYDIGFSIGILVGNISNLQADIKLQAKNFGEWVDIQNSTYSIISDEPIIYNVNEHFYKDVRVKCEIFSGSADFSITILTKREN